MYARSNRIARADDLHELINEVLISETDKESFTSYKRVIKQYFLSLETNISATVLHEPFSRYTLIGKYQLNITDVMQEWWRRLEQEKERRIKIPYGNNYRAAVYYYALNQGTRFLEGLFQHYPDSFHEHRSLPPFIPYLRSTTFLSNTHLLLGEMYKNRVDRQLINSLQNYFSGFADESMMSYFKWHHWHYALRLAAELPARLSYLKYSDRYERELIEQLIMLNFNYGPFCHLIREKMAKAVENLDDEYKKEEQWLTYQNQLALIPEIKKWAADSQILSIRKQLLTYSKRKRKELRKRRRLWSKFPVGAIDPATGRYHFQVSLTERQLLFFFRVLLEMKILIVDTKKMLFAFIADFIGTPNREHLALHSLLSKDTIPSQQVINKVKQMLTSMLNYINSKYP
ncbi:hypothetical protein QT327_01035 [Olivibacter sp. 47]|uniref:hypothetical protein n=1 Tax=Olivibacter sp. 47 TaxID=3056486 RepID=UPI0025A3C900|nr:hypothetical protein [Olivibacter sp. 47]MDM8172941.1 hypothetical protein [Olivibacter sp. 47]